MLPRRQTILPPLLFGLSLVLPGCTTEPTEIPALEAREPERGLVILDPSAVEEHRIELVQVKSLQLPETLTVVGKVGVNENLTVRVGALTDGRIIRILKNVGDQVSEGAILADLRSHEVDDTRAQYAQAVAGVRQCEAELEFASNAHERAQRLFDLKAGSLEEVQRAEANLRRAETNLEIAKAEIGRLRERLAHLGLSVEGAIEEYTSTHPEELEDFEEFEVIPIPAPISGTVLERRITPGSVVSPADDLFVISDLAKLWVHAEVPERYLASLKKGQRAQIEVEAYPDRSFPARLSYIGDVLNAATRTIQVRCDAENRERLLRPEMYANVSFNLGKGDPQLFVPQESIQNVDGETMVFVLQAGSTFKARRIKPGRRAEVMVAVVSGLEEGERIASKGSFLLKSEMLKSRMVEE